MAFLVHPNIHYEHRPDLEPVDRNFEICCIQLKSNRDPTFLFCCYRPPRQDMKQFLDVLRSRLTAVNSSKNTSIFLFGDFNARSCEWLSSDPSTAEGQKLIELFDDYGLSQVVINRPTRFSASGSQKSLLDLVSTNIPYNVLNLRVLPSLSDHCPVIFDIPSHCKCTTAPPTPSLDFRHVNWTSLNDSLWNLPLDTVVVNAPNVNDAWEQWYGLVADTIHQHIPTVLKPTFPKNKPWFCSFHHRLRRRCNRLFAAAKRNGSPASWTAYRFARNQYVSKLRQSKLRFHTTMSQCLRRGQGTYTWWKKAKSLCGISQKKTTISELSCNGTSC